MRPDRKQRRAIGGAGCARAPSHSSEIEERLFAEGLLTDARRKRLAQYFYKELRVLSLNDRAAFNAAVAHIHALDPSFQPRGEEQQPLMRILARILGFRNAILLHSALKRAAKGAAGN
jgi:hypothetical protein